MTGTELRKWRDENKMSRNVIQEVTGQTYSVVAAWELGREAIPLDAVEAIEDLKVRLDNGAIKLTQPFRPAKRRIETRITEAPELAQKSA